MNQRSDTDRVLRHWLADGPSQMPDRVLDVVADRISRQPQRRTWRLVGRHSMIPGLKYGIAAVAVLAIAVVGYNLLPRSASIGGPAVTPAATVATTPGPAASPVVSAGPVPTPTQIACEDNLSGCAGPLTAGSHGSANFGPRLIHYVTPAGWTNSIDTPTIFKLDAPDGVTSILLWTAVSIEDQTATSCEPIARAGGESPSAAEWVAYLTSHPGLVTTSPSPAHFPGTKDTNAQSIDVTMDPGWTQTCPGRTNPEVVFIAHRSEPPAVYGVGPDDKLHLVVLDTSSYGPATVLIEVYGPRDDAGFSAAVDLASGVMDTFVFGCGVGAGYGPCSGYPSSSSIPSSSRPTP